MPIFQVSGLVVITALLADLVALVVYRRALVRRGLRAPYWDVLGEATASIGSMFAVILREFELWMRDLFKRRSDRALEACRMTSLFLILVTIVAFVWAVA